LHALNTHTRGSVDGAAAARTTERWWRQRDDDADVAAADGDTRTERRHARDML
jgi:hypothetical protein